MQRNFLFDIDGTITDDIPNERPDLMETCQPFPDAFKYHGLITDKPRGGNYVWIDNLDVTYIKYQGNLSEIVTQFIGMEHPPINTA